MINPGTMDKRITLSTNEVVNGKIIPKQVVVWAEKKSITRNEFYASYQSGLSPQIVFSIRSSAYKLSLVADVDGTKRYANSVIFDGTTYNVIRAYELDDIVELTCS